MKKELRVVLTGGGTGGHIYPAVAIAGGIKAKIPKAEISFLGTAKGLESEIIPHAGYPIEFITVEGMERKFSYKSLLTVKDAFVGVGQAIKLLKNIKPDVVIGTGGYVSGPVVLAASILNIPAIIHEQNAYPGITNKILNPLVEKVLLTFPEAKKHFLRKNNLRETGLPVRKEVLGLTKEEAFQALAIPQNKFVVTVVGGSRGARSINIAMTEVYRKLGDRKDLHIIHVTGENDYEQTLIRLVDKGIALGENVTLRPYMHDIKYALSAADVIVGRAGASFLSEILVLGIPAILIPYPFAAENHQHWNAMSVVDGGAALMINDKELSGEVLCEAILDIMKNNTKRNAMHLAALRLAKPHALDTIVNEVIKLTV